MEPNDKHVIHEPKPAEGLLVHPSKTVSSKCFMKKLVITGNSGKPMAKGLPYTWTTLHGLDD
jgi:hypothetical protein